MSALNPTGTSGIDKIYWGDLKAALVDLGATCKGLTGAGHSETYELCGHSLRTSHDKDHQRVGGGQLAKLLGYIEAAGVPRLLLLALLDRRGAVWYGGSPPEEVAIMSAVLAANDWRGLDDPSRWAAYLCRCEQPSNPEPKEPEEEYVQDLKTREYLEQQAKEHDRYRLREVIAFIHDEPAFVKRVTAFTSALIVRQTEPFGSLFQAGHIVIEGEGKERQYLLDGVAFVQVGEYVQNYYHSTWRPKHQPAGDAQRNRELARKAKEMELERAKETATVGKLLPEPKREATLAELTQKAPAGQTRGQKRAALGLPQALLALCRYFDLDPVFAEGTMALDLEATVLALGERAQKG